MAEVLYRSHGKHGQGVRYVEHVVEDGRRLRVLVHLDTSYRDQSRATVDVWVEGRGFETVIEAFPEEMHAVGAYYGADNRTRGEMERGSGLAWTMEETARQIVRRAIGLMGPGPRKRTTAST